MSSPMKSSLVSGAFSQFALNGPSMVLCVVLPLRIYLSVKSKYTLGNWTIRLFVFGQRKRKLANTYQLSRGSHLEQAPSTMHFGSGAVAICYTSHSAGKIFLTRRLNKTPKNVQIYRVPCTKERKLKRSCALKYMMEMRKLMT